MGCAPQADWTIGQLKTKIQCREVVSYTGPDENSDPLFPFCRRLYNGPHVSNKGISTEWIGGQDMSGREDVGSKVPNYWF